MDRRTFIAALSVGSLAGRFPWHRRLTRVGLQLYSLRDDARKDLERTLVNIAAVGYQDVELLGSFDNFGMPVAQLRQILDRNGLRAPSTHVAGTIVDDLDRELDKALTLGLQYLIVASLPIQGKPTLDVYRHWADRMNEAGRRARERGVWIGFHNHAGDLAPIDGAVPYDLFLERTDASVVRHQLDMGNIAMGNRDPFDYLRRYGSRYFLFHIKNVPRYGSTNDAELAAGILEVQAFIAAIPDVDHKLLYVEQETYPSAPLDSVRRDFQYVSGLEF